MMQKDLLAEAPLITYLGPDEKPHAFMYNDTKGIERDGHRAGGGSDASYRSICLITEQRILFITAGAKGETLRPAAITGVETTSGRMKHKLSISTAAHAYTFYVNNSLDAKELDLSGKYIEDLAADASSRDDEAETSIIDGLSGIWTDAVSAAPDPATALSAEPQGSWVTAEHVAEMGDTLDKDEKVHYMFKGGTIDVEGSTSGESLWGNDRDRKPSLKGIYTAVTDKRVVINIPQFLGDDERHIPYSSIVSCDLDTGIMARRVSLQTKGPAYHIQAQGPNKDELRNALRFIRNKAEEANTVTVEGGGSEPDPTEQLKNIKELHESGVLSDEEFEAKKQKLLDKI